MLFRLVLTHYVQPCKTAVAALTKKGSKDGFKAQCGRFQPSWQARLIFNPYMRKAVEHNGVRKSKLPHKSRSDTFGLREHI